MKLELLLDLAKHQAWADAEHWKILHANAALLEDQEIRKRLNHMVTACEMLQTLARGEAPDPARMKEQRESTEDLEIAMQKANEKLAQSLETVDLEKMIA